jgi:3-oxoadipate enol-lactonase
MYRADRGEREFQNLIGEAPLEALADIRAAWPDMYEAVVTGAFGGTLARPELDRGLREIATVAILAATGGSEPQLATHTRAALLQGVAPCAASGALRALSGTVSSARWRQPMASTSSTARACSQ